MLRWGVSVVVIAAAFVTRCEADIWDFFTTTTTNESGSPPRELSVAATVIKRLGYWWTNRVYDQPVCARFPTLYASAKHAFTSMGEILYVPFDEYDNYVAAVRAVKEAVSFFNTSSAARKYSCVDGHDVKQLLRNDTEAYRIPNGCMCRRMQVDIGDASYVAITTKRCARSTGVYNATTLALEYELPFSYMGCFVGNASHPASHADCPSAVPSVRFKGAMFARCVNTTGGSLDVTSLNDTFFY